MQTGRKIGSVLSTDADRSKGKSQVAYMFCDHSGLVMDDRPFQGFLRAARVTSGSERSEGLVIVRECGVVDILHPRAFAVSPTKLRYQCSKCHRQTVPSGGRGWSIQLSILCYTAFVASVDVY